MLIDVHDRYSANRGVQLEELVKNVFLDGITVHVAPKLEVVGHGPARDSRGRHQLALHRVGEQPQLHECRGTDDDGDDEGDEKRQARAKRQRA